MKLFISQPMKDRTDEEIEKERQFIVEQAKLHFGNDLEVIDSFFKGQNKGPLVSLADSLKLLDGADIAWFAFGWQDARGCVMEHLAVEKYLPNVTIVESHSDGFFVVEDNGGAL